MRYPIEEVKTMPIGWALDYLKNFDNYYTEEEMREYIAEVIEYDDYILAMHLLETLIEHSTDLYYYDRNTGTATTLKVVDEAFINNLDLYL